MKVILLGASGMVGQGVLRECLLDSGIEGVLSVGRSRSGTEHPKFREIVLPNLYDLSPIELDLTGYDACLDSLGISAVGLSEEQYNHQTYDLTLGIAGTLARLNPDMTFIYVSGAGTDSTEHGRTMWARVKGRTENALLRLPFRAAYMFRPAMIQPLHGIRSKTRLYRLFYDLTRPLLPLFLRFPGYVTTSERLARAMIEAARNGAPRKILESRDINALAQPSS